MLRRVLRIAGILLCAGVVLGANQCQKQDDKTDGSPTFITSLSLKDASDTVQSTFKAGAPITLELSVYNRSDSAQTLWFNTSEQANFAVVDAGTATVIWNYSATQSYTSGFTSLTFKAHETKTFTVTWDQTDNTGTQLASGEYEIMGGLSMYNRGGQDYAEDDADAMATGSPDATQLSPTQYRSVLTMLTIE